MEKRKWLWKRKTSDKSPGETESSGSISSPSERNYDDQHEAQTESPNHDIQSPEVASRAATNGEDVHVRVKNLTEKLSAALVNVSAKDDLVKQHAKVAEEAVAGWEKAENEVVVVKQQLEDSLKKNLTLEDRVSHLDGALKECVRQLRQAREEQEQKIHEAVKKKNQDWEATKSELETQILELQIQVKASTAESLATVDPDICHKLELLEREYSALKFELFSHSEELEFMTIERDLSTQAAETASKQHLESIKKMAKLEAECRMLKAVARKSSSVQDQKSVAASSLYVDSVTDSQSDSGERLNAVEIDTRKMSSLEVNEFEQSCSDSWASALIAELDQFKNEKAVRNLTASGGEIDLMDDFLEMERLAALPQTGTKHRCLESETVVNQSVSGENPLRAELEAMHHHTTELEEKLGKMEARKAELEEKLEIMEAEKDEFEEKLDRMEAEKAELKEKLEEMEAEKDELEERLDRMEADRAELEMDLSESQDCIKASQVQLNEAEMKLSEMQRELHTANEKKQFFESQLVCIEVEARTMCAKVESLEAEVEKERALSAEIAIKYRELEDELSRKKQEAELRETASSNGELKINQEDLVVAAGKLAECQQTIASLGKQLKSLATLEDFLIDTTNLSEFSEAGSLLGSAGGEVWRLHSNDTFLAKRNSDLLNIAAGPSLNSNNGSSPPSSSNHVSSEKSRNGFVKLFSRSKGGIQLENQ